MDVTRWAQDQPQSFTLLCNFCMQHVGLCYDFAEKFKIASAQAVRCLAAVNHLLRWISALMHREQRED